MKKLLLTLTIISVLVIQAEAFCIWKIGTTCKTQDIINTATNQLKVGDVKANTDSESNSIASSTNTNTFNSADQIQIKNFNELINENNRANQENLKQSQTIFDSIKGSIEEGYKKVDTQFSFWKDYFIGVRDKPPTIPISNGSPPFIIKTDETQQNTFTNILNNLVNTIERLNQNSLLTQSILQVINNTLASTTNMSIPLPSTSTSAATSKSILQTAHGLAVGDWVYLAGVNYTKTDADLPVSSDSVGVVTTVTDVNNFTLTSEGYATGLTGLVAGTRYYLSATAGAITVTAPASNIKAVFIADSTTSGYVQQYAVGASSQALTYASLSMSAPNASVPLIATTIGAGYSALDLDAATLNVRYDPTNSMKAADNSFTVPTTGLYEIIFNANITTSNGSISIYVNGSRVSGSLSIGAASNADAKGVVYIGSLTAGQRVEFAGDASAVLNASVTVKQLPTAVAPVVNTVAGYGEQVLGSSVLISNTSTNSGNATDIMSFTIPSEGTWDIDYTIRGVKNETNADNVVRMVAIITNNSNSVITNSEVMVGGQRGGSTSGLANDLQASGAMRLRVTTTGATTYKVRGFNDGSSGAFTWTAVSDGNGRTKVSWNKIAGQLPSTGTTVDYVNVYRTSNISVPGLSAVVFNAILSGNIPYNTSNGQFTLTAGKTYKLAGNVNVDSANGGLFTAWYNVTSGAYISPGGRSTSADSVTGTFGSNQAELIFTPTVTTIVELRNTLGAPGTAAGGVIGAVAPAGIASQATIVQLGSTSNTVGTLPAVDQSSAGYFDIGNMRIQWGRVASTLDDNETFTFPMPFSTTPSVQATIEVANGGNYPTGVGVPGTGIKSVTTTNFIFNRDDTIANTDNPFVNWHAFGQKP